MNRSGKPQKLEEKRSADESLSHRNGNLIVVAGPSGVGKGTVVERLLSTLPGVKCSVSVTTRSMRKGEQEGEDYFFRGRDEFIALAESGAFLEWAEFAGNFYGTPREWVCEQLARGIDVILEIEVKGARQIKEKFENAVLVFLSPPSFDALKERLTGRATETPEKVQERLTRAREELEQRPLFHYEVVNDNVDEAVADLVHILRAERCRIKTCGEA